VKAMARFLDRFDRSGSTRAASPRAEGTTAPAGFRAPASSRRAGRVPALVCGVVLALAATLALGASSASAAAPTVTIENASEVSYISAHVKGTVDPGGEPTTYRFQYISEAQFQENLTNSLPGFEGAATGIEVGGLEGTGAQPVEGELAGLAQNTTYHLRLQAENGSTPPGVPAEAIAASTFTTKEVAKPAVTIENASEVSYLSAKAEGTVELANEDPAFNSSCVFEYIANAQYEENIANSVDGFQGAAGVACEPGAGTILGTEAQPVAVSANLAGLTQKTTYHLRLAATNSGGTTSAVAASTFKTKEVAKPVVTIENASEVSYLSAKAEGSVELANADPAFNASCEFQYATEADFSNAAAVPCEPATVEGAGAHSVTANLTGLAPATTYHLRILAANPGGSASEEAAATFETLPVAAPAVSIDPVTAFTATTAHLEGEVDPQGTDPAFNSSCRFDYVTDAQFNLPPEEGGGFAAAASIPCEPETVEGTGAQAVKADLTGLVPHTTYHLRLVASNAGGQSEAVAAATLTTKVQAPLIANTSSANVTADSADLRALINPGGGATTYHFDYGTEEGVYDQSTPESGQVGSDNSEHQAAAHITGLTPETTYHFRIVATNTASPPGGTLGPDRSFTTQPATSSVVLPDGRQWELVSPPDKHGAEVGDHLFIFGGLMQAAESGDAVTYITNAPITAISQSNPLENQVLSKRGPGGWSSQDIATPHAGAGAQEFKESGGSFIRADALAEYWAFSPDLSLGYAQPEATTPLAPPAPAPKIVNASYDSGYVRDNDTGKYSITKLDSEKWYDEQVALSAPAPKCDATTSPAGGTVDQEGVQAVSQDGCYVYFNSAAGAGSLEVAHYDGAQWSTTLISSLLGPGTLQWGAGGSTELSPNGRYLTFMSDQSLTGYDNTDANSPLGEPRADQEAFLYDAATNSLTCPSCDPTGARPVGRLDSTVVSELNLNADAPGRLQVDPAPSAWKNRWLAGLLPPWPLSATTSCLNFCEPRFAHQPRYLTDGGELFFESPVALVPQDVNGTWDVYEYQPQGTGGCAKVAGCDALISAGHSSAESVLIEASTDGSDVFFFTSERLTGQDVDHVNDVYDAHVCSTAVPCPPPPPPPSPACEGDACQQPAVPTNHPTPGTTLLNGPENLTGCPRGKQLQKGKCVKKAQPKKKNSHKKSKGKKHNKAKKSVKGGGGK
jgi:hypothetical protein